MNLRGLLNLLALGSLVLTLAGCASSPRSGQYADADDAMSQAAVPDPNKPSMFFSGGNIQQVRGAAMGAAVTQGWEVQKAGRDSLILQRNLDDAAAENLAPGASRGPLPPVIEVRTDFFDRSGGVEVQLGAEAVTARGTNKEVRQDYTETYRNELTHSLSILQNSWHEAGPRIANALPPIGGMRDTAPTDSPASESIVNSAPATPPPYSMVDIPEEVAEERQPSSAVTWSLPPAATATAVARANTLPSKTTPAAPVTKFSQAPKVAPPVKTPTKVATVPAQQSLMLKPTPQAPRSTAIPPKSVPIFTQSKSTAPSGKPAATTAPKMALAGAAKSPTVAASPKSAPVVNPAPKTTPKTTALVKATTVTATKTAAAAAPKTASPSAPTAKAAPPATKAPAAKVIPPTAKAPATPITTKTTAKVPSDPRKTPPATTSPNTPKTKAK